MNLKTTTLYETCDVCTYGDGHDILTKGLGISVARVMGQVENSVPCVMTSQGFPYIIFPGNVGTVTSLRDVYKKLNSTHKLQ